jgi:hypothetical protein
MHLTANTTYSYQQKFTEQTVIWIDLEKYMRASSLPFEQKGQKKKKKKTYSYSSGMFFFISSYDIPSHTPAYISSSARHCIYQYVKNYIISNR